jgi:hypothetical protein
LGVEGERDRLGPRINYRRPGALGTDQVASSHAVGIFETRTISAVEMDARTGVELMGGGPPTCLGLEDRLDAL